MKFKDMRVLGIVIAATLSASGAFAQESKSGPEAPGVSRSVEWSLDAAHSNIGFVARHLGFAKVKGEFKDYAATVSAHPKTGKITALSASAKAASVSTGISKRDDHLRADDFFNAEQFPELRLKLKAIRWSGKKFRAQVELTIRDVTKVVPFTGELLGLHKANFGGGDALYAGYEARATINRKAFGLAFSKLAEGVAVVSDNVEIQLNVEISRKL